MSNGLHPCSISSKESENTLVPQPIFAATFDALMAIGGREPFHPFSIGSPGSFAHSPIDPS
jgi:hypothetical protein